MWSRSRWRLLSCPLRGRKAIVIEQARSDQCLDCRVQLPARILGEAEMVRRDLGSRGHAFVSGPSQRVDRLPRREVHEVERALLDSRQREVALDHEALG